MLKFIIGIAFIGFTTFCGHLLAGKYRKRKCFFAQFREFNDRYLSEISYLKRPIEGFIAAYSYQGEFDHLLQEFFLWLRDETFGINGLEWDGEGLLTVDEKQLVSDYFLMLGKGDSLSQKNYFSSLKDRLIKIESEANNEAKRYEDLYVKLGFLCGLFVLILLV